jgi:hypothetical protein
MIQIIFIKSHMKRASGISVAGGIILMMIFEKQIITLETEK